MVELLVPREVRLDDDFASPSRIHHALRAVGGGGGRTTTFDVDAFFASIFRVDTTGDDHVLWRHWVVVYADR